MADGTGRNGPRYRQIADALRARIVSGEFTTDGKLPSITALRKEYDAAEGTVDRALTVLRREGIAETIHGSGTFVRDPGPRHTAEYAEIMKRIDGLEGQVRQLSGRFDGLEPPEPARRVEPVPVVAAIVTAGQGVLITRRKDGRPAYGFVAGEIEPGESPAHAGVREVKEETGLEVTEGHEIGRRIHPATARTIIYMAAYPASARTAVHVGDESELAEVLWVELAEAERLMPDMFPVVRDYLRQMLKAAS